MVCNGVVLSCSCSCSQVACSHLPRNAHQPVICVRSTHPLRLLTSLPCCPSLSVRLSLSPVLLPAGAAAVNPSVQAMGYHSSASPQAPFTLPLCHQEASLRSASVLLILTLTVHPIARCRGHQLCHCHRHRCCQGCCCCCHCCCCCCCGRQGAGQQQGKGHLGQ